GPPPATLARRAKSYSDFYDIVRAHVRRENKKKRRLGNDAEFGEWYGGVKNALLDASHGQYQLHRDQLQLAESHLQSLLSSADAALKLLAELSASFKAVEAQTTAFQAQCEGIVADQNRTTKLADDIAENLQYYAYLEPTTKRLNAPGAGNLVRRKEFAEMLANLDACLEYMQAHAGHREAASYRSRYRLLLTRALTLIRNHFAAALRDVAADVTKRIADRQLNDTTMSALLYAKFRVPAPELKQIGLEIQRRADGGEGEYQSLVNELYDSYAATRGKLLRPIIAKKMADIAGAPSTAKDLVAFARSSIAFMRGVCADEYTLWGQWFASDEGLYGFLEGLCEAFYDYIRPRTIHETQLLKLCELCTLIQTHYMHEESDDEAEEGLDFSVLVHPCLQDAQTRLVFLALSALRNDIENYKPRPEDLEPHRPAKSPQPALSGRRGPTPRTPVIVEEDGEQIFEPALGECYPTLRKAVWLLSRIYRLVHSAIFDDLAHQIVHQTTLSLHSAAAQIATKVSPTDSQLFLIKHLLVLKQQIVAFDIEFVTPDVSFDFGMTSTFYELRARGGLFNPANLVRLLGGGLVPKVVTNMLDAKSELDGRLRTVINDFVSSFAKRMTAPLAKTLDAKAAQAVRDAVERDVLFLRRKLDEYLEDARTRETLVAAVLDQVTQAYEDACEAAGGRRGAKGKGREDQVWEANMFSEWAAGVFNVGRIG
ncbi:Sec34-domain-containing protein, partial [Trichodelitschia bisporula]